MNNSTQMWVMASALVLMALVMVSFCASFIIAPEIRRQKNALDAVKQKSEDDRQRRIDNEKYLEAVRSWEASGGTEGDMRRIQETSKEKVPLRRDERIKSPLFGDR